MMRETPLSLVASISEGYWSVCNDAFDRSIHTAEDMRQYRRGNCFTLSEFLCEQLIKRLEVIASGVCIEVLPSRRNYHASSWAVTDHPLQATRFDLLNENPTPLQGLEKALSQLAGTLHDVLYVTTADGAANSRVCVQQAAHQRYAWPEVENTHQAVYLSTTLGVQTLHSLARAGGIQRLLTDDTVSVLPSLPRS